MSQPSASETATVSNPHQAVIPRHVLHLCVRDAPDAARRADRRRLVPRRPPGREDARRRAPPRGPRQVRPARTDGDPEYGIKNLLVRNLEHLSPAQSAKVTGILGSDPAGQQIAAAWIAKEKLRHTLNLRARPAGSAACERNVRDRLFAFYDWCAQNDDIPELVSPARTISRWQDRIICAVLTGITNPTSESLNRLAKLEARLAYGFRNPAIRTAGTRGTRHSSRTQQAAEHAR